MTKVHRSAVTGQFVSRGNVARHRKTTVTQTVPSHSQGNRSAISGRFISNAAAARRPKTSVREGR